MVHLKKGPAYVSVLITFRQNIISLDASLFVFNFTLGTRYLPIASSLLLKNPIEEVNLRTSEPLKYCLNLSFI